MEDYLVIYSKGLAVAGVAMLAAWNCCCKVGLVGGKVREGGKNLLKKGINFIRNRKKKKLEKKQGRRKRKQKRIKD